MEELRIVLLNAFSLISVKSKHNNSWELIAKRMWKVPNHSKNPKEDRLLLRIFSDQKCNQRNLLRTKIWFRVSKWMFVRIQPHQLSSLCPQQVWPAETEVKILQMTHSNSWYSQIFNPKKKRYLKIIRERKSRVRIALCLILAAKSLTVKLKKSHKSKLVKRSRNVSKTVCTHRNHQFLFYQMVHKMKIN